MCNNVIRPQIRECRGEGTTGALFGSLMQMLQLVGVPHHINCCDLPVFDFERGRLKFAIGLLCDDTGQSVEEAGTNKLRAILREVSRQRFMDLHDGIEAEDRPQDWN